MFFIHVDDNFFDRLKNLVRIRITRINNFRTRHGQFKTFAAHLLDQNSKLQFATACDFERILIGGF